MNRQFPALRGFAIFLVVINHSIVLSLQAITQYGLSRTSPWETYLLLSIKEIGVIAVPIFLFLAGAFMMYSLKDKTIREGYRLILPALKNVVIPYIIWSFIFYLFVFLLKSESYSVSGYLKNIIVGYPFNFVPILVFFIILAPLLAWILKRYSILILIVIILYQLLLVNLRLPGIIGFSFPSWVALLSPPVLGLSLALWGIFYPLGMIYIQFSEKYKRGLNSFVLIIGIASFIAYCLAAINEMGLAKFSLAEWVFPIITLFLLPFIERKKIPFLSFFENLGKRSYGIYLMNLTIIMLLVQATANYFHSIFRIETIFVVIMAALTIFITTKLMGWIERKLSRKIYYFLFG